MSRERHRLRVTGTVQGVGFRPFVYRLARTLGVAGWVRNDPQGVAIDAEADPDTLAAFTAALTAEAPPAARVAAVALLGRAAVVTPDTGFVIAGSDPGSAVATDVSPDRSVCDACLAEMRDPHARRFRYPFVNCTHCGPRYSITWALPYDRPLTTMRTFALCGDCAREYHDPDDRRFHAQPIACPRCGPQVRFVPAGEERGAAPGAVAAGIAGGAAAPAAPSLAAPSLAAPSPAAPSPTAPAPAAPSPAAPAPAAPASAAPASVTGDAAIAATVAALRAGAIVAIKGLGGYHLACDARNEAAVAALRERKFRREKPFALMARDLAALAGVVALGDAATTALTSPARPIVLAPKGPHAPSTALAPQNADLGVMLPSTPLQHLLFDDGAPELLVMTSANRSSEPIAYRDDDALLSLEGLADAFLIGEREIARRVDDSVVMIAAGRASITRRARGFAPAPVLRDERFHAPRLALGAELKSSVALAVGGAVVASQHLGDLTDFDAVTAFQETVFDLCATYRLDPRALPLVHDRHVAYASSRFAEALGGPRLAVPHHAAHVASVLAEHGAWDEIVLGFAFDGAGLGDDGGVWGGEVFHGSLSGGLRRVAHARTFALPGADAAARTPVQAAVGLLAALGDDVWPLLARAPFAFDPERVRVARALLRLPERSPACSSVGRLFDAAAALLGFHASMSFEGQAAIALEALAAAAEPEAPYPWPFDGRVWDHAPLLRALMQDAAFGVEPARIARRFHEAIAAGVVAAALALRATHPFTRVALSGGVFQNRLLTESIVARLERQDIGHYRHHVVPTNDGGIALGQLALAAYAPGG